MAAAEESLPFDHSITNDQSQNLNAWFMEQQHSQPELCLRRKQAQFPTGSKFNLAQVICHSQGEEDQDPVFLRTLQGDAFHKRCSDTNTGCLMPASDINNNTLSQSDSPFNSASATNAGDRLAAKSISACAETTGSPKQGSEEVSLSDFGCTIPGCGTSVLQPVKVGDNTTRAFIGKGTMSSGKLGSPALSAQASTGAATTKVSKRRSRASNKAPITVLSADTNNFRAMVQQLTGIPTSPPMQWSRYNQVWNNPSAVKPHPVQSSQSIQGLRQLQGFSSLPLLHSSQSQHNSTFHTSLSRESGAGGVTNHSSLLSASNSDHLRALLPSLMDTMKPRTSSDTVRVTMPMSWDAVENERVREKVFIDCVPNSTSLPGMSSAKTDMETRQVTLLDGNMLVGNEKLDADLSRKTLYTVDSWLSSEGALADLTPKVELAHSS